ncbi:MAG TPA: protein phosphatase 2C domain-containing protein, partial [Bellilinea sp.]|nr:protein phosphatase 2C domain-containing protein [Bellilinea sp.]
MAHKKQVFPSSFSEARVCGIRAGCLWHICQDAIGIREFTDSQGERVLIGAVSDGCSGSYGSQFGARFIVDSFLIEAEKLGKDGKRDSAYIREVALAVSARMSSYKPRLTDSEIVRANGNTVCEELYATLYGFVADKERILFLFAGDGSLSINDHKENATQVEGDIYPAYLLLFPQQEWARRVKDVYVFAEFRTNRVRNLLIASDGFESPSPKEYPGLADDPAKFILHAKTLATEMRPYEEYPGARVFRGGDDTSVIALGNPGASNPDPVSPQEVKMLASEIITKRSEAFTKEHKGVYQEIIRQSGCTVNPSSSKEFERKINENEDVECIGITDADVRTYGRERNSIFASRIFHADPLGSLLGISIGPKTEPKKTALPLPRAKMPTRSPLAAAKISAAPQDASKAKRVAKKQLIPFSDICSPNRFVRHGIGFRQFGRVMYDLWHFVNDCHRQGLRIGNLRPQDLLVEIIRDTKPPTYRFSLMNPDSAAAVDDRCNLVKDYARLDLDFVHPEYAPKLKHDDRARLDQDWYAYSVLCYWFVTKYDPFGEGTVKAKPDADRIYRMQHVIL